MDHSGDEAHAEHTGATVRTYVVIFVVLFAITVIEVAASFLSDYNVPVTIENLTLIALAVVKGALVVLYYMHLRFDSRWFRFFFTSGIILATFGLVVLAILFSYRAGQVD